MSGKETRILVLRLTMRRKGESVTKGGKFEEKSEDIRRTGLRFRAQKLLQFPFVTSKYILLTSREIRVDLPR